MSGEREEELETLQAIYPELVLSPTHDYTASLDIPIKPVEPLLIRFIAQDDAMIVNVHDGQPQLRARAHIEHDVQFSHLPPLKLHVQLPQGYPESWPPRVSLSTPHSWLPLTTILDLQKSVNDLWEECGRGQTLFAYIDYLQQTTEQGFGLIEGNNGPIILPMSLEPTLRKFDRDTAQTAFDAGTYDCGICLEPKKGHSCHKLEKCGHIFCKQCFQDYYNNAIEEGDVVNVRCLNTECEKGRKGRNRSLHPRELLAIGLQESMVRRYVEMKRKKKLESDKTTVYCPRTWCQHPARSVKYPPIPANLLDYPDLSDIEEDAHEEPAPPVVRDPAQPPKRSEQDERLAICEECKFAFCRTCFASWHGSFVRCFPKDSNELTAEDKASYEYIMLHTSPCPTCSSPISKTLGCNHMNCYQCQTHFCYLCSSWLNPSNPYEHFNTKGTDCYQRLWELEEGDDGQAPADGRGFAGARAWEALAIEAAREADREEAEQAAAGQPVPADAEQIVDVANVAEANQALAAVENGVAHIQMNGEAREAQARPPPRRRRRNLFPARPPAGGAAAAVRAHERQGVRGGQQQRRPPLPALEDAQRQGDEMRRFIELALRDEEEGWDSDDFSEDDAAWHIA